MKQLRQRAMALVFASVVVVAGFTLPARNASADVNLNQVRVVAVTPTKAILRVGAERYVLRVGESTPEGVQLVSTASQGATLRSGGREELVPLNLAGIEQGDLSAPVAEGGEEVTIRADAQGSFYAGGSINGKSVRFLVDTGASLIALSGDEAQRLGINLDNARPGIAQTASGNARMWHVMLKQVDVGDITLYNVEAGIIDGRFPHVPLLGMSFLNQLTMHREGSRMHLKRER